MAKIRLGLIGASGRMGSSIAALLKSEFTDTISLTLEVDRASSAKVLRQILEAKKSPVDVFIDVSSPIAGEKFISGLLEAKVFAPYIIGSTGWEPEQLKTVRAYSKKASILVAPNFSMGVNLLLKLIEQVAPLFQKWGYEAVIHETHHNKKKDAPSGTANALIKTMGRLKPQVHSTRAGNIVGTHEVRFIGPSDILTLSHEALDRSIFARGALLAAQWISQQTAPGLYSMQEIL